MNCFFSGTDRDLCTCDACGSRGRSRPECFACHSCDCHGDCLEADLLRANTALKEQAAQFAHFQSRLGVEIHTITGQLDAFKTTRAYDSGVRLAEKESYLKALKRCARWAKNGGTR